MAKEEKDDNDGSIVKTIVGQAVEQAIAEGTEVVLKSAVKVAAGAGDIALNTLASSADVAGEVVKSAANVASDIASNIDI